MSQVTQLNKFIEPDYEKIELLESLKPKLRMESRKICHKFNSSQPILENDFIEESLNDEMQFEEDYDAVDEMAICLKDVIIPTKYCPKCGGEFGEDENFCPDCLVTLKRISDKMDIKNINAIPDLSYSGSHDYSNILTEDNFGLIDDFDFTFDDFYQIIHSIKLQAFKNFDKLIKDNSIILEELDILDKVILFAKSFARVEYKSYGQQLGYFEFDKIYVDDRQTNALQITTLIHELSHFLIKEILTRIVCKILDCNKNKHVEAVVIYILSNSVFNSLIDEYAAHNVEGRFTIFGYQDYSSFIALQGDLDEEHVEMSKVIGNTFSIYIKNILEGFLDWDVRDEIKKQFLEDTIEIPNYKQLKFENSNKLSDEGFMKAIWLILSDGFQNVDLEVVNRYIEEFSD